MIPSQIICKRFGFSLDELISYSHTCPHRYKTYPIKKRQGGTRLISQPSKDLKIIQRFILSEILNESLIVHDAAKAYKCKTSIMDNAAPHLNNSYLLKTDFTSFFPSIRSHDFIHYLRKNEIVGEKMEAEILARIFFKNSYGRLVLSIGSPGSPIISNALLYDLDEQISSESKRHDIKFTRYSDDMTFSTCRENILFEWPEKIKTILVNLPSPKLALNDQKLYFHQKNLIATLLE